MYEKIINGLGLSKVQAEIFDSLLINGADKASNIAKKIKRPRGVAYKGLEELTLMKLVIKNENKKGIAVFSAEHPSHLESILDQKEKEFKRGRQEFLSNLPDLVSAYNLVSNKPGVRFYEGEAGIEKSLNDTLLAKDIIYTFADVEAVENNVKEINDAYAKKREKQHIKKRVIVADTPYNRDYLKNAQSEWTEFKFLSPEFYQFNSGVQIYDNKVSYQVIAPDKKMAVIIEDANIYQMNKLIFEYLWQSL